MVRTIRYRGEHPTMDMVTLRRLERVRNLQTLIQIRDDPGDGSPACDANRLAACRRIDPKGYNRGLRHAAPVDGSSKLRAGYVIRLPPDKPKG
jgi:hypothetical protein